MPSKRTLLVVDDDMPVRLMLASFLGGEGYDVIEAADGAVALQILGQRKIDFVLSDMDMPNKSGKDLLLEVKKNRPQLPVVIITGRPRVEAAVECIKIGALDYLTKPCDLERLAAMIKETLASSPPLEATRVIEVPRRLIGGYKVLEVLGEGGMGIVFLAEKDGRRYALKIIRGAGCLVEPQSEYLTRFTREAAIATAVRHPNIIPVVEYGIAQEEKIPYMVMEYCDGVALDDLIKRRQDLPYATKVSIVRQIAAALEAINAHGICHRDVKPNNVLVDAEMTAKLTDFGIARLAGSELTGTEKLLGSPPFMAPESFAGVADVDHRADIFSLGVVAYLLFTGQLPFAGNSMFALAENIRTGKPTEPRKLDPQFPPVLQRILAKALKKKPEERYGSATEMIASLDQFLSGAETPSSPLQWLGEEILARDWR
ncbi:MAG: hypothetical protein A3K19_07490 [Lentisphaerae bacterium RIFOXYB12_FULL_65_16]|nr:MAG: hypothetical protein A3K18_21695 [Lentisphaerae bacterium RIFOXYA12_64_32]OGV93383.1 MAG: hypothetical protein A3K19_07490 [Lentisphaerae bacterium RIFOXYB12_FULL_65_16]